MGGKSQLVESTHHEFARQTAAVSLGLLAKAYEVTTLFGGPNQASSQEERSKYSDDYKYIGQFNPRSATAQQISSYFNQLVKKVKSGDQVEIYISAHGSDTCGSSGLYTRNDIGSSCNHTFTLFDETGNATEYLSAQLFDYLKQIEDKGALPTIVFNSCHSGRLKNKLKQVGLRKTCSYFQTAGNEVGYGCFDDDPDFSKDFTSTGEYISLRYYQHILGRLSNDPYFSGQNCFNKVKRHYEKSNMNLNTINSAYWSSRLFDETLQSPSTSDQLGINYFSRGVLFPPLSKQQPLSSSQTKLAIDELFRQVSRLRNHSIKLAKRPLIKAVNSYDDAVAQLKVAIKDKKSNSTILSLQQKVNKAAKLIIAEERKLIGAMFGISKPNSSNCQRSL